MKTLQARIAEHGIRMACERADRNPNMPDSDWSRSTTHWRCTFRNRAGRQITVHFSQGSARIGSPKATDVLDCIASDTAGFENARGFEDWASDYGYDTDSRKAERTYNAIKGQAFKLRRFIGSEAAFQELLFDTERL